MVNDTRLTKISLSNIYKDFKNVNGSSLQIPLQIQPERWTIVAINVGKLLEDNSIYVPNQPHSFFLRSLQLCSTVNVRGVFTSDIEYQVNTLPKDLAFKLPKDSDWFSHYNWFSYPRQETADQEEPVKENSSIKANVKAKPSTAKASLAKKKPI